MKIDDGLSMLVQQYLDGVEELRSVHEYVSLRVGDVDDALLEYVAMEIWQFQDGYRSEDLLRVHLAELLQEFRGGVILFGQTPAA